MNTFFTFLFHFSTAVPESQKWRREKLGNETEQDNKGRKAWKSKSAFLLLPKTLFSVNSTSMRPQKWLERPKWHRCNCQRLSLDETERCCIFSFRLVVLVSKQHLVSTWSFCCFSKNGFFCQPEISNISISHASRLTIAASRLAALAARRKNITQIGSLFD